MTIFTNQETEFRATNQHGKTYTIIEKSEDKTSYESQSVMYKLKNEITFYWVKGRGPAKKIDACSFFIISTRETVVRMV